MAYIKIDETNRITAASETHHCGNGEIEVEIPEEVWENGIHGYKYQNGEFVHDPLPAPEQPEPEANALEDRVNTLETDSTEMKEALEMILNGVTE